MLNIENFDLKLDTDYIGRNFVYSEETDSTNLLLLSKGNRFNINGTVAFAEKQIKGKGRKDRIWYSTKDQNLTFSILINEKKFLSDNVNLINLASSLAVSLSIENLYQLKPELKWPNDILINGKKTSGILLEASSKGSKIEKVVIGIGINANQTQFQGNFSIPPTSLKLELNHPVERERLLAEVLNNFEELLEKTISDPGYILKDWKLHCKLIGERISVTEGDDVKYGIFDDLDPRGFLLLRREGKIEKIHLGDISSV